jgi:hypothetical protein
MQPARVRHAKVKQGPSKGLTVLLFGHAGSWKTTWSAQWPGVVFISIASEGGDDALSEYPNIAKYLADNATTKDIPPVFNTEIPPIFEVRTCKEFVDYIELVTKNKKAWGVCTVVIDGLIQLIDIWKREYLEKKQSDRRYVEKSDQRGGDILDQQAWGFLNLFLSTARVDLQNHGLNVIWTTYAKEFLSPPDPRTGERDVDRIVPMIPGQNFSTLPAQCKLWIYASREKRVDARVPGTYIIQPKYLTKSTGMVDLRHKYLWKFPHGKLMDPDYGDLPTFRAVYYELHENIYMGQ